MPCQSTCHWEFSSCAIGICQVFMIISQVSPNTNSITLLNTKTECTYLLYKLNITKAWIAARTFFYNLLRRNDVSKASKQILHKFLKASSNPIKLTLILCSPMNYTTYGAYTHFLTVTCHFYGGTCLSTLHDLAAQGLPDSVPPASTGCSITVKEAL